MPASSLTVAPLTASGISHVFYDIPTDGLIRWYDFNRVSGISSGGSISALTDYSGIGNHLAQSAGSVMPLLLTGNQNGLSVGSALSASRLTGSGQGGSQTTAEPYPRTVAITFSLADTTAQQCLCGGGNSAQNDIMGLVNSTRFQVAASAVLDSLFTLSANSWYVGGGIFTGGSNSTVFITGVASSAISVGSAGTAAPTGFSLFARGTGTFASRALIGEVLNYNRALTAVELSQLTTYLRNKWL